MSKQDKRELLYNDFETFNYYKKIEDDALAIFDDIQKVVKKAIGDANIDYIKLFADSETLVETYINTYRKTKPAHLDSKVVFKNDTGVDLTHLDVLLSTFNNTNSKLSKYKITVVKNGIIQNLKESDFNKYLNENVREKYFSLVKFVESAKALSEFYNVPVYNVARCSDDLLLKGLEIHINYSRFI